MKMDVNCPPDHLTKNTYMENYKNKTKTNPLSNTHPLPTHPKKKCGRISRLKHS